MDIILGDDIYSIISAFFNDFNDIIILCQVCKSMRYYQYNHNVHYRGIPFIINKRIPLLNINLISIYSVKPCYVLLEHIKWYTNLKKMKLHSGLIDIPLCNILEYSTLETLCYYNVRIDDLPTILSLRSLELSYCIMMQCIFNKCYGNIIALHLDNPGFIINSTFITYFPNLEYFYVDYNTFEGYNSVENNNIVNNLSKLKKLKFLHFTDINVDHHNLIQFQMIECLFINCLLQKNKIPILYNIKYLFLFWNDHELSDLEIMFPNIKHIISFKMSKKNKKVLFYHSKETQDIVSMYYNKYFSIY